jgi:PleD family two-component response regulator
MEPGLSKLRVFKARISTTLVHDTYTTPDDLAFKVGATLGRFIIQHTVKEALEAASASQQVGPRKAQNQVARRAERLLPIVRGARILLVNDVPDEMRHVIRILRELSLKVAIATSTDMGLAMLKADTFDAVISPICDAEKKKRRVSR